MGGTKKKSAAQMDKGQSGDKTKKESSKKDKKQEKQEKRAEITVIVSEDQALRLIKSNNFITAQEFSRQTGVKISTANACLGDLLKKGTVKRVGGFSGHWIYQMAA